MKRSTFQIPLFFLLTVLSSIPFVHASSDVDLTQIPQLLADKTGFPVFACGLIVSAVGILVPNLVLGMIAGKAKNTWIGELFITFFLSGAFIAIGWVPAWLLIVISLIVSFAFAEKLARVIIQG